MARKTGRVLVVGAGIGGIRASLDLAEVGYAVTLIDRSPAPGGTLTQLDHQFPTNGCGMCKMLPLVDRDASSQQCLRRGFFHENVEVLPSTHLASVQGEAGRFQVVLDETPRFLDPERCMGCGLCETVCPVQVPDPFNAGLTRRKAVHLAAPCAVGGPYVIDAQACTRCGACEAVCPTGAIRLRPEERKGFRVLVVDDERIVRDSLRAWLEEEEGFTAETAASGAQALEKLAGAPYQLMLLDIKMPGMDGVEVLQRARKDFSDCKVVMMTAYATVDTAVEAMKLGALDYLVKPFDPEGLMPKIEGLYRDLRKAAGRHLEVGAIVLCSGTSCHDPADGKNPFGYGVHPGVVTSLQWERVLGGAGPFAGRLLRPGDCAPLRKIAWIHCVGSRDLQSEADYCSNICCMACLKEAVLTSQKAAGAVDTALFYMDLRTFGKTHQRYREEAVNRHGLRLIRARVHSVAGDGSGQGLVLRYVDGEGFAQEERFDVVVLGVGQRPAAGTDVLAERMGLPLNAWGFFQAEPFSLTRTVREGIVLGGAGSEPRDIGDAVIQASAAALEASLVVHRSGGALEPQPPSAEAVPDVSMEAPRILVAVCSCRDAPSGRFDGSVLARRLSRDPEVKEVVFVHETCTETGWRALEAAVEKHRPNRLLLGACFPQRQGNRMRALARDHGLDPFCTEVADIHRPLFSGAEGPPVLQEVDYILKAGLAALKRIDPGPVPTASVRQSALVVGGGIAGMSAALAVADHGLGVDLVERGELLGGNLRWLGSTLEEDTTQTLLEETCRKVQSHPFISVHRRTEVVDCSGEAGSFLTTVKDEDGSVRSIAHGVTILATGAVEAVTQSHGYGRHPAIVTQKELEQQICQGGLDLERVGSVVMVQCVDSRQEPRNYCSRVCCGATLKHALYLKRQKPDLAVHVLYRQLMSYGFSESRYTEARKAGVLFIQYEVDAPPQVRLAETPGQGEAAVSVEARDPIIGRKLRIEADLLVLAVGVVPNLPPGLAAAFGVDRDRDGFFQEAESKWRPVDALKEGVFACGLVHSPRTIRESIATAQAAAQRALRLLSRQQVPGGKRTAGVRASLCSLCRRCIDTCPFGARSIDPDSGRIRVHPLMCQGCGACAAACPNDASFVTGFSAAQMLDTIDAALDPGQG